eukprot:545569-Amorphochlora_amoeboformis.AAC.1
MSRTKAELVVYLKDFIVYYGRREHPRIMRVTRIQGQLRRKSTMPEGSDEKFTRSLLLTKMISIHQHSCDTTELSCTVVNTHVHFAWPCMHSCGSSAHVSTS